MRVPSGDHVGCCFDARPTRQLAQVGAVGPDRVDVAVLRRRSTAAKAKTASSPCGINGGRSQAIVGPVEVRSREPTMATLATRAAVRRPMRRSIQADAHAVVRSLVWR